MVVFDASTILLMLSPTTLPPVDPVTQRPINQAQERIDHLLKNLEKARTKIIIPTPALSEILVKAGNAGPQYLAKLSTTSAFRIVPFDQKAAVEVAAMNQFDLVNGPKKHDPDATWAKIKYDRQIVAIGKVENALTIYSDDKGIATLAKRYGISVIRVVDLPLAPEEAQMTIFGNETLKLIRPPDTIEPELTL